MKRGAFLLAAAVLLPAEASAERVKVLVPDKGNLQFMSFWVAKGGGHLAAEGIEVDLVVPDAPQQSFGFFERHEAEVAVLPPPIYVNLIAAKKPAVLVANLLANDPINLVVSAKVMAERKLDPKMPLKQRLEGLRGLRIGIAPHPPTRLRALYASVGLDADQDVTMEILHGKEQNAAFHAGEVDALYAHTPYLERAIVHDGAVVLVEQTRGEVPVLAHRQIHALVFHRELLAEKPDLGARFVKAIAAAQTEIHTSQPAAVAALAREHPDRDRRELETIVRLYEPAIPRSPDVRVEDIPPVLALFPAGMPKPDLAGIDLRAHVATDLAPKPAPRRSWLPAIVLSALGVFALLAFWLLRRRRA